MKFGTRVCLNPSNDRGEFELDQARSKSNIAENSLHWDMKCTIDDSILSAADIVTCT